MHKTDGSIAGTVRALWTADSVLHRNISGSCLMVPGSEARGLVAPIICLPVLTICRGSRNHTRQQPGKLDVMPGTGLAGIYARGQSGNYRQPCTYATHM